MRLVAAVVFTIPLIGSELVDGELATTLVPSPVKYSVLLPDGYGQASRAMPLILMLHGGGGTRDSLRRSRSMIEEAWKSGALPPVIFATPSAERSYYMDYKDGSQKWEQFLTGPFLAHLREKYKVWTDRKGTLLFGVSMGGLGALRLGFKYPQFFGALAALEPGIEPAIKWKDVQPQHRFWRSDALLETIFGKPFDAAYWEANNPASIVAARPERLRSADLAIYIECGDEDSFGLDEATEFLHRLLRDNGIKHEYHLVRGADHVGRTIRPRSLEALAFLGRYLDPPPPDPSAQSLRRALTPMKKRATQR
jgi:S-formylglutathione hydrolase